MDKLLIFLGAAILYSAYNDNVDLTLDKFKLMLGNSQFKKLLIIFAILLSIVQFSTKNKTLANGATTIAVLIAFSHLLRDRTLFNKQEQSK